MRRSPGSAFFVLPNFRTDAAWGVKRRRPDFWPRWRMFLKRIKPDLLLRAADEGISVSELIRTALRQYVDGR